MKRLSLIVAVAGLCAAGLLVPASAQVLMERKVIMGVSPLEVSPQSLLRSDFIIRPSSGVMVTEPRVLSFPAVFEVPPSSLYKPGIHLQGRYDK
jgi:hypothetical protein